MEEEKIISQKIESNSYHYLQCRPVIMEAVCACGEKCFHGASYIFKDTEGDCIPPEACPVSCIVSNLQVDTDNIVRVSGTEPDSLGCFKVCGSYDVRVVYEVGDSDVRIAKGCFKFDVNIPVQTDYGCVLCTGTKTDFCLITKVLQCISADVVQVDGEYAIKVVVEKQFFVVEQGETLICLPVCPVDECGCIPPGPIAGEQCIPFRKEPTCDEWCYEDEIECPGACNDCPPEQTTEDDCIY